MDRNQIVTLEDVLEQCKQIQTTLWNLAAETLWTVDQECNDAMIQTATTADLLFLELKHAITKARAQ